MSKRCKGFTLITLLVVTALIGILELLLLPAPTHAREDTAKTITEKTLVVWVSPGDLEQAGGGVLCLDDRRNKEFDAIVFAELKDRTWMSSSPDHRRTSTKQDSWPEEDAPYGTVVQIAAVYEESQVSLYRNAKLLARYPIEQAHGFKDYPYATVLMGIKYDYLYQPSTAFFKGFVEEARVYDRPLSMNELSALTVGDMGDTAPLGCWDFEDGRINDLTGNWSNPQLYGGAYVDDGKLYLDGKDDFLIAKSYMSLLPKRKYSNDLESQLKELANDPVLKRFKESRKQRLANPYTPLYHFINPENHSNDPNGFCFWQGRWHLFYQGYPPEDPRPHWGHAVSDDMIHWRDLPYAIYPEPEEHVFSGGALVEEDRVIAMYHGTRKGNMIAVADDPLLLNWNKLPENPVIPIESTDKDGKIIGIGDPCIWKGSDGYYYSICGGQRDFKPTEKLFRSKDLKRWEYLHHFFDELPDAYRGEDGACPYFWPIGDKHILIFLAHIRGPQYLLGDYDQQTHKFTPYLHGRFNNGVSFPGSVFAPSATPDGNGGVYAIFCINEAKPWSVDLVWNHIMSQPIHLTLNDEKTLNITPVPMIETLRDAGETLSNIVIPANETVDLEVQGSNTMEIVMEVEVKGSRDFWVSLLRSPDGQEHTDIHYYRRANMNAWRNQQVPPYEDLITIDTSRSSLHPDIHSRAAEQAPFQLEPGETLKLRIFVDRGLVEVFANDRQFLLQRVYPKRDDSRGISLGAWGDNVVVKSLTVYQMKSIYTQ